MFDHIRSVVSAGIAAVILSASAQAREPEISLSPLLLGNDAQRWDQFSPLSIDLVAGLNGISERAFAIGHERLSLDRSSPRARLIYLGSAGFVHMAFSRANALVFGHEMAHWQAADLSGLDRHAFIDHESGARVGYAKAYLRALVTGHVRASAASWASDPALRLTESERSRANNAGTNWNAAYSERMLRDDLLRGHVSVPGSLDYIANRSYHFKYAFRNAMKEGRGNGDFHDFARYLETRHGESGALDKMAAASAVSLALSPSMRGAIGSLVDYVEKGELNRPIGGHRGEGGVIYTWDTANYMNADSYTIAPTFYAVLDEERARAFLADRAVLGVTYERSILGESVDELTLTADLAFERGSLSLGLSFGGEGHYAEVGFSHDVGGNLVFRGGLAGGSGETLRGMRAFPQGGYNGWASLGFRF